MENSPQIIPIENVPMINGGDDLGKIIHQAISQQGFSLLKDDVVCVAQKIVSKSENRLVALTDVSPSEEAIQLAKETEKDPRLVQLILEESDEILRKKPGVLIVRHRLGIVGANAGIDQSNIDHQGGEHALLLPEDPDASAKQLRMDLQKYSNCNLGVLITDSHNRPWRLGTTGSAIGAAGIQVLDDRRGGSDLYGRELKVTLINRADAIASITTLYMGETTEKIPVAIFRGNIMISETDNAKMINRALEEDLFR
jgi:coenzyme F420-0:L-glutamate ligase/coenzyme F420-1:gamma-L-glutamate ligase